MARETFNIDDNKLRQELESLSDIALQETFDSTSDALYGPDALSDAEVQDCTQLEELAIRERAIIRISNEIIEERTKITTPSI
ncbi:MAG: hypothetical protein COB36_05620 [Alphaproteobacteria bacterium]|nr:MAG: hypothetical protein COB36_05620 [Alphaproteobacteria bacterium]